MRAVWALFLKELRVLGRDPFLLVAVLWFFTAEIYVAGTGIRLELHQAPMAVVDEDHSLASRQWQAGFHEPWFRRLPPPPAMALALKLVETGRAMLAADIPPRFSERIERGQPASIQLFLDGANVTLGSLAASYAQMIHARFNEQLLYDRLHLSRDQAPPFPHVENRLRLLFNQANRDSWFMAASELFAVMTLIGMLLPAALAVREKERGTIEQLLVAPLTPTRIMLPKLLAVMLVMVAGFSLSLWLIMHGLLGVPVRGSPWLLYAMVALYAFSLSGLGLFVATITRNVGQVMLVVFMLMLPMLLLSGAWTPPESMPSWEQALMHLAPLYHFNIIGNGILFKGSDLALLWPNVLQLAAIGLGLFLLGAWRFRKMLA
ncbi:ABC transporter permease [Sulfurivirga sp.]|uniref:ABC transporter permease n=1 Tax=Sulfurivirga sp. TaxID=2614236 RepID=UPI0025D89632|nr:ABC transporter permease [Sulfurivirga sp.]